jgi:hypothetical protein
MAAMRETSDCVSAHGGARQCHCLDEEGDGNRDSVWRCPVARFVLGACSLPSLVACW